MQFWLRLFTPFFPCSPPPPSGSPVVARTIKFEAPAWSGFPDVGKVVKRAPRQAASLFPEPEDVGGLSGKTRLLPEVWLEVWLLRAPLGCCRGAARPRFCRKLGGNRREIEGGAGMQNHPHPFGKEGLIGRGAEGKGEDFNALTELRPGRLNAEASSGKLSVVNIDDFTRRFLPRHVVGGGAVDGAME